MLHRNRCWSVAPVATAGELAEKLTEHTWTGCMGFELQGYLFLNDSTCADGAQEFAVSKAIALDIAYVQIESITSSWCTHDRALTLIRVITAGEFDSSNYGAVQASRVQTPAEHRACHLCQ